MPSKLYSFGSYTVGGTEHSFVLGGSELIQMSQKIGGIFKVNMAVRTVEHSSFKIKEMDNQQVRSWVLIRRAL